MTIWEIVLNKQISNPANKKNNQYNLNLGRILPNRI